MYDRAEMLADLEDLAAMVAEVLDSAQGAGVDQRIVPGIQAALVTLDPGADTRYDAGPRRAQLNAPGFTSDVEMAEAVVDAETEVEAHLRAVTDMEDEVIAAIDAAGEDLDKARRDQAAGRRALAAARRMPVREPCNGCHHHRRAAITAAQGDIKDAEERAEEADLRLDLCEATTDILEELEPVLRAALDHLARVLPDLGEVWEPIHVFLRAGGKLSPFAREWHSGQLATAPGVLRLNDHGTRGKLDYDTRDSKPDAD